MGSLVLLHRPTRWVCLFGSSRNTDITKTVGGWCWYQWIVVFDRGYWRYVVTDGHVRWRIFQICAAAATPVNSACQPPAAIFREQKGCDESTSEPPSFDNRATRDLWKKKKIRNIDWGGAVAERAFTMVKSGARNNNDFLTAAIALTYFSRLCTTHPIFFSFFQTVWKVTFFFLLSDYYRTIRRNIYRK